MTWQPCWLVDDYGSSQIHHRVRIQVILSRILLNNLLDIYDDRAHDIGFSWLPPLQDGRDRLGVFIARDVYIPHADQATILPGSELHTPLGYQPWAVDQTKNRAHMTARGIRFDGEIFDPSSLRVHFKSDRIPWRKLYGIAGLHYVSDVVAKSAR
jgi:hypothetical protein